MALRRPFLHAFDSPATFPSSFWGGSSLFQTPSFEHLTNQAAFPPVSIEEKQNGFEIVAELPGMRRDEINVSLGDQNRRIIFEGNMHRSTSAGTPGQIRKVEQGQAQAQDGAKQQQQQTAIAQQGNGAAPDVITRSTRGNFLVDERRVDRQFHRSFTFQTPLNPSSVKAKLEHGMLKVSVKKATQDEGTHSIQIE